MFLSKFILFRLQVSYNFYPQEYNIEIVYACSEKIHAKLSYVNKICMRRRRT